MYMNMYTLPDWRYNVPWKVGYNDEKHFMRRFKQLEDITPTKFRNAFSRTKIVR